MRNKIRMKNAYTSMTQDDLIFGGKAPKYEPRPDSLIFVVQVGDEPPEGWRPERLR